jgi:hypothetical protein
MRILLTIFLIAPLFVGAQTFTTITQLYTKIKKDSTAQATVNKSMSDKVTLLIADTTARGIRERALQARVTVLEAGTPVDTLDFRVVNNMLKLRNKPFDSSTLYKKLSNTNLRIDTSTTRIDGAYGLLFDTGDKVKVIDDKFTLLNVDVIDLRSWMDKIKKINFQ